MTLPPDVDDLTRWEEIGERLSLAPRETDAVRYTVHGLTATQTGIEMDVSPHTVRHYLRTVYAKLGVHSKVDLMMRVMEAHDEED